MLDKHLVNIKKILEKVAEERSYEKSSINVVPVSSGGANYTSQLFRATISSATDEPELKLFVKVAAVGEEFRDQIPLDVFGIEYYAYTKLSEIYKKIEDKHNIPEKHRLRFPKYYGANLSVMNEVVVLEDLNADGFIAYDRFESVDWAYAKGAIEELAKLHSLSFAYEQENPEGFAKTLETVRYDYELSRKTMKAGWDGGVATALKCVRDETRHRLEKFANETDIEKYDGMTLPIKHTVIVHRDYRISNQLYRKRDDGSTEVITVDFQTMHGSSPVIDLLYFIFTGTDKQFRDQYYEKMVEYYHDQLTAAMLRLGLNADKYSKETYKAELEEKLPFGLATAIFLLPLVLVDSKDAPAVNENLKVSDIVQEKPSDLYVERINDIVDDYIAWGVL